MTTKVYGASDDLIEVKGELTGEVGYIGPDREDRDQGCLLMFSDGTLMTAKYGKAGLGVWQLTLVSQGSLFRGIVPCTDEEATPHSDVATFGAGLKWAYAAKTWELVQ